MANTKCTISNSLYDAFIFDLDGVITKTAAVHAAAWKKLFDTYLQDRGSKDGKDLGVFDQETDYRKYVDGKPRYKGVQSFLKSRDIDLPYGTPDDSPNEETICGLGNKKNQLFQSIIKERGVEVYEHAMVLIHALKSQKFKLAVVSSSKNCRLVLTMTDIEELFDCIVDGLDAERLNLQGKPDPDIYLEASRQLGVSAQRAVVVEDAVAGVEAGYRGKFGCVIGVDRGDNEKALKQSGADRVVKQLSELEFSEVAPGTEKEIDDLPSALDAMQEITERCSGKRVALFLDYDGTLTPIVSRPEDAVLSEEIRKTLQDLVQQGTVAVISGRDLQDVRNLVGIEELIYAGSHGFDIAGPAGIQMQNEKAQEFLPLLDRVEETLRKRLKAIQGTLVERKKFSIAVHYRAVKPKDLNKVTEIVKEVLKSNPTLRMSSGKKVYDLQPDIEWNKGKALLWLLEKLNLNNAGIVPFYIGDDTTDEDAFIVLAEKGISIVVKDGNRKTAADYLLGNPDHVKTFLRALIPVVRGDTK